MHWDDQAREALKRVPFVVRPLAKRKIEDAVRAQGRDAVSLADYEKAEAAFRAVRGGRGEKELASVMPAENRPGVEMVVMEACRARLAQCPNTLIDTEPWQTALEDWLRRDQISERLRQRVADDKVLFHHKLKITLAGCPNGCSRPQIADLAVVGAVEPSFDPELCTACGACADACPDQAIIVEGTALRDPAKCQGCRSCSTICPENAVTLGQPFARLTAGGKLGRHPHLALPVGIAHEPADAVEVFSPLVERYLREAPPGMRFAAWVANGGLAAPGATKQSSASS